MKTGLSKHLSAAKVDLTMFGRFCEEYLSIPKRERQAHNARRISERATLH